MISVRNSVNIDKKTQQNPNGDPPAKNFKRPRKSEANVLPKFSKAEDALTLESSATFPGKCDKKKVTERTIGESTDYPDLLDEV